MGYAEIFLCAASAWFVACLFIAMPARQAAINGGVAGACCALPMYLLSIIDFHFDVSPLLFLFIAATLPLPKKKDPMPRLMALLPSLAGYAMLTLLCLIARGRLPALGSVILTIFIATAFCAVAFCLRKNFPPEDWQEYFGKSEAEQASIRLWHIFGVLGISAGLNTALMYTAGRGKSLILAIALFAAAWIVFWGALYCVCLMVVCRRERLTVLVDQNYRSEMQAFMSVIRSQRHDYNFHVQTLSGLIDAGDIDECREYLHNLVRDSVAMNTILPVKDPAIAALIFSFRTMALENGIELHIDIQNDLSCVATSTYETNKIIGNLLQNAIDEVRTHADKSFGIHLYILKRGENCIIHAANRITPQADAHSHLQEMYRPGFSTKAGHEGIGLSSIQNLLRRYRGVVYSRLDGDIIHCVAKIPLKIEGGEV